MARNSISQSGALRRLRDHIRSTRDAGVALGVLSCLFSINSAQAETLKAHYGMTLMGLSIGTAYASGYVEPKAYRIEIGMRTTGLANLVNSAKGAATATGAMSLMGPSPAAYSNSITNSEETRTVRMSLSGNAVRAVDIRPEPWDLPARVPLGDTARRHVVDPVSALIMSVPAGQELSGPAACERTISVFDGVTRFDVSLSYAGSQTVEAKGYAGPVVVCTARYTPIAGHRPDSASTRYMSENHDIHVWLAPLPETHVVLPIHIDIGTAAGELSIDASEFTLGQRRADSGK
ncbi:MAG: DUF3108 domain-containing protein [Alphaproteobacteria bacterium]|nr:DUF3108 domain-containing protein [Alphaproteobacteria bacterium]